MHRPFQALQYLPTDSTTMQEDSADGEFSCRFEKSLPPTAEAPFVNATFLNSSPEVSPTEIKASANLQGSRKARMLMGAEGPSPPTSAPRQPSQLSTVTASTAPKKPSLSNDIAPWDAEPKQKSSSQPTFSGSFYNDDSDVGGPTSPVYRSSTSRTPTNEVPDPIFDYEARRPSVISATSVSSQASKRSDGGRYKKGFKTLFNEDYSADGKPLSDPAISSQGQSFQTYKADSKNRLRADSAADRFDRPHTPAAQASSDVTPWDFDGFNVSLFSSSDCMRASVKGMTREREAS